MSFKGAIAWYHLRQISKAWTWPTFKEKTLLWLPCQNTALSHASGDNFFLFLQQPKHDNQCYLSRNPHRTNDGRGLWHTPCGNRQILLPKPDYQDLWWPCVIWSGLLSIVNLLYSGISVTGPWLTWAGWILAQWWIYSWWYKKQLDVAQKKLVLQRVCKTKARYIKCLPPWERLYRRDQMKFKGFLLKLVSLNG